MPFGKSFCAVLAVLRKSALNAQSAGREGSGACMGPGLMSCSYCLLGRAACCGEKPCSWSGKGLDTSGWFPPPQPSQQLPTNSLRLGSLDALELVLMLASQPRWSQACPVLQPSRGRRDHIPVQHSLCGHRGSLTCRGSVGVRRHPGSFPRGRWWDLNRLCKTISALGGGRA